jgi:hypothetical protein
MDGPVAQLAVNRLAIVPITIHPVSLRFPSKKEVGRPGSIDQRISYSDIVNYNTISLASFFIFFFLMPVWGLCSVLVFAR